MKDFLGSSRESSNGGRNSSMRDNADPMNEKCAGGGGGSVRVISLLPAATDSLVAMGLTSLLIGRSHECDAEGVLLLPKCTIPKLFSAAGSENNNDDCEADACMSSVDIHMAASTSSMASWEAAFGAPANAAQLVKWNLSPYCTSTEALALLKPTVILTQIQEEENLISRELVEQAVDEIVGQKVLVIHLDPKSLNDVLADIEVISKAVDEEQKGHALLRSLRSRMETVRGMCAGRKLKNVLCVQWVDPLFLAGAWVPEIIQLAGGFEVGLTKTSKSNNEVDPNESKVQSSIQTSWEELRGVNVESIVFAICGFGLEGSRRLVRKLKAEGIGKGMELRDRVVAIVDGAKLF